MSSTKSIFRDIVLPFWIFTAAFLFLFTGIHWIIIIQMKRVDEVVSVSMITGFILALIASLVFMWKRINRLKQLKNDRMAHYLLATLIIGIPNAFAQEYLIRESGKLTILDHIGEYYRYDPTRYYRVRQFYTDKQHTALYLQEFISGKHKEDLNFQINAAVPVLDAVTDTAGTMPHFWLCVSYKHTMKTDASLEEQRRVRDSFTTQAEKTFYQTDFHDFEYWQTIPDDGKKDDYFYVQNDHGQIRRDALLFLPREGSFKDRSQSPRNGLLISLAGSMILWPIFAYSCGRSRPKYKRKPDAA